MIINIKTNIIHYKNYFNHIIRVYIYDMITPYTLSKVRLFKAILPIMIVLHHLSFFYGFPPGFARLGIPLVACFFLMSGYGLMTSYQSKGLRYFDGFIWHISKKLLMPYLLAIIAYIPLVLVVQRVDLTSCRIKKKKIDWLRYSGFVFAIWAGICCSILFLEVT